MGFPIRKSADQRLFAPPHSLSQRTTSFIASQRQGIHRIPLLHLIALIIDIHHPRAPSAELTRKSSQANPRQGYDRKDQFCFKHVRERAVRRRSRLVCSQPENPHGSSGATGHTHFSRCQRSCAHRRSRREAVIWTRRSRGRMPQVNRQLSQERETVSMIRDLVEPDGIEPTTSCLQSTRSPN